MKIEKVALPAGSLIAALPFTDHADAFRTGVDPAHIPDVDAFARAFVRQKPPAWIAAAMRARDAIVGRLFGLKTSPGGVMTSLNPVRAFAPGEQHGIFRVFARTDDEILFGEDDRHLDFRVSLFYERAGDDAFVTVSTVVRFNNALGRAYFFPVRPVHGLVVPSMLRRALQPGSGSTISSNLP